jgi:hypothetical protein
MALLPQDPTQDPSREEQKDKILLFAAISDAVVIFVAACAGTPANVVEDAISYALVTYH